MYNPPKTKCFNHLILKLDQAAGNCANKINIIVIIIEDSHKVLSC